MAYDLEEQDKLDALKAWWEQYGSLVIAAVAAFVLSIGGVQGWRYWQTQQAQEAAAGYAALEKALLASDLARARQSAQALRDGHAKSPYAPRAALAAARLAVDIGDLDAARAELQWAAANAREDGLRDTARLRLARVQFAQQRHEEALATLGGDVTLPFRALFADLRGDVLLAQGKADAARTAYQDALDGSPPENPYRALVEVKRDALPGGKP